MEMVEIIMILPTQQIPRLTDVDVKRTHRLYETLEARCMLAADAFGDDYVNVPVEAACLISEANPISGRIEIAGDLDVFAFDAEVGEVIRFEVASEDLSELRLDVMEISDSGWLYATKYEESLTWKVRRAGRYAFRVSGQNGVGDYSIAMSSRQDVTDQVSDSAPPLMAGTKIKSELEAEDDVDVFALPMFENQSPFDRPEVVVKLTRTTTHQYPILRVVEAEFGRRTIKSDRDPELIFSPTARGVYYVEVASGGALGEYELEFEVVRDDHPSLVNADTVLLQIDDTFSGRVDDPVDMDAFAFHAVQGVIYRVEEIMPSNGRLNLSVYTNSGRRITSTTEDKFIVWKAPESGLSRITVGTHRRADVRSRIPYQFALTELGDDLQGEFADDSPDFGVLPLGVRTTKAAVFDYTWDEDTFAVELTRGDSLRVLLTGIQDDQRVGVLKLLAPDGSEVPTDRNGHSDRLTWKAVQDGRHVIIARGPRFLSPYELVVELVADDWSDQPTSETLELRFDELQSGSLEVTGDVDAFHLRLDSEQAITFPSARNTLRSFIRVVAPSGEVVTNVNERWRAFETGLHVVEISHQQLAGEYAFTPTLIGRDDHADSMSVWTNELPRNVPTTVSIEERADVDVLRFDATLGEVFEMTIDSGGAELTGLWITIAEPDQTGWHYSDSPFLWKAPAMGPFSLRVSAQEVGTLTIRSQQIATDDHADHPSELTAELQDGETLAATMSPGVRGDVDVFVYHATQGDVLQASLEGTHDDVRLGVLDSDVDLSDQAMWIAHESGPIYIEVRSKFTSEYAIRVDKIRVDIPQSLDETAPTIPLGVLTTGHLETHDDEEVYALDAVAGQSYVVYSDVAYLLRWGNIVSEDGDNGYSVRLTDERVLWRPKTTGRHYFTANNPWGDSYSFSIDKAPASIEVGQLAGDFHGNFGILTYVAQAGQTLNLKLDFAVTNPSAKVRIIQANRSFSDMEYVEVTSAFAHDLFFQTQAAEYQFVVTSDSPKLGSYSGEFADLSSGIAQDIFQAPATLLPRFGTFDGQIQHPFDQDILEVNVLQGEVIRVRWTPTSPEYRNLGLRIFSPDRQAIKPGGNYGLVATWKAEQSGRYRIVVGGEYGSYRLTTSSTLDLHADSWDTTTTGFVDGQPVTGVLEFNGDVDVFHIDVAANTVYRLSIPPFQYFSSIRVTDAGGKHVPQLPVSGRIRNLEFATAGRYYFSLVPDGLQDHQAANYEFVLEQLQDDPDSVAGVNDGARNEVRSIRAGTLLEGSFEKRNDVDVFAVDLEPGDRFLVHVVTQGNSPTVRTLSADGELVAWLGSNARLVTSETGGRYYLELTSRLDLQEYTVELTPDPVLQLPADLLPAPTLTFGERYFDEFTNRVDQRLFAFTATEGIIYRVTGPRAYVIRENGERLPTVGHTHKQGVVYYDWKAEESGLFYLVIDPTSFGRYSFTLREFPDDITNLPTSKVPVVGLGEEHSGLFNTQTDVDVIGFDVSVGDLFGVTAKWVGLSYDKFRVLGPDGTTELAAVGDSLYRSEVAGRHFVEVNSQGRLGPYYLVVERNARVNEADAPDEPSPLSPLLTLDEPINAGFYHSVDIDAYAFDATAGRTVKVVVVGRTVAMSVVASGDGEYYRPVGKTWTPKTTGRFFVVLSPWGKPRRGQTEDYTVEIRSAPVHLPASKFVILPPPLTEGLLVGEFERDGKQQQFALYARRGEILKFDVESESSIRIDVDGALPMNGESTILAVGDTGRHLVKVTAREPGPFRVRYKSIDDHANFVDGTNAGGSATPLLLDQINRGVLELRDDIDVFSFSAAIGQEFQFDVEAGKSTAARLLAADGSNLYTLPKGHSEWLSPRAGKFYVEVTGSVSGEASYTLGARTDGRSSDLDGDGTFSAQDIDALFSTIDNPQANPLFDQNADGRLDSMDRITYFERFNIVAGDANLDGRVDFADFLALSGAFQSSGGWQNGDFNGDQEIGFADFLLLADAFATQR